MVKMIVIWHGFRYQLSCYNKIWYKEIKKALILNVIYLECHESYRIGLNEISSVLGIIYVIYLLKLAAQVFSYDT